MSFVNILNIQVLDNPTIFTNPFQFEITFECTTSLQEDLEWKIIYVGSAEDEQYDQVLDCIMVGPVPVGINKFVYQADAPNPALIPSSDVTGVTVALITCSYKGQEFIRVGYYVNNEYMDEDLRLDPPSQPVFDRLQRNILADKPRVTRFPIKWDVVDELEPPQYTVAEDDAMMMDEETMLMSGSVLEEELMDVGDSEGESDVVSSGDESEEEGGVQQDAPSGPSRTSGANDKIGSSPTLLKIQMNNFEENTKGPAIDVSQN